MKLPVKPTKGKGDIINEDGWVCFANTPESRDEIIKAINCHKKFKTALTKIRDTEVRDSKDNDPYDALGICKSLAGEALKEKP